MHPSGDFLPDSLWHLVILLRTTLHMGVDFSITILIFKGIVGQAQCKFLPWASVGSPSAVKIYWHNFLGPILIFSNQLSWDSPFTKSNSKTFPPVWTDSLIQSLRLLPKRETFLFIQIKCENKKWYLFRHHRNWFDHDFQLKF